MGLPEIIYKDKIYDIKSLPNRPLFLFCDILNSHKSYLNVGSDVFGEVKLSSSNLLAVIKGATSSAWAPHYPSLQVKQSCLPMNQLILRIKDENGIKPQFNGNTTFSLQIS